MKELNELVKINDSNEIVLKEDVVKKIEAFNDMKKEIEYQEKLLKAGIMEAMEELDLKTLDIGNIHATYKDSYVIKSVDTNKLKRDGLYEIYEKETIVKPSIVIKVGD